MIGGASPAGRGGGPAWPPSLPRIPPPPPRRDFAAQPPLDQGAASQRRLWRAPRGRLAHAPLPCLWPPLFRARSFAQFAGARRARQSPGPAQQPLWIWSWPLRASPLACWRTHPRPVPAQLASCPDQLPLRHSIHPALPSPPRWIPPSCARRLPQPQHASWPPGFRRPPPPPGLAALASWPASHDSRRSSSAPPPTRRRWRWRWLPSQRPSGPSPPGLRVSLWNLPMRKSPAPPPAAAAPPSPPQPPAHSSSPIHLTVRSSSLLASC
mmetsp:Transcript_44171/g.84417  ORF Transcript_44171/g.84417 Transcript_44171/m.84417 type:complete len:267 (+) Transcript_44171:634-1434(+)